MKKTYLILKLARLALECCAIAAGAYLTLHQAGLL